MMRRFGIAASCLGLAACGSCSKEGPTAGAPPPSSASEASNGVVAEALPRCRGGGQSLAIPGEDVIVGDVAMTADALLVGVLRTDANKRVASVIRAPLDLATSQVVDIGTPLGDAPPPSPRWNGSTAYVSFFVRHTRPGAARDSANLRELHVARLEQGALGNVEGRVVQQADESMAFDLAWSEAGVGLVAWDEDATLATDAGAKPLTRTYAPEGRGFVKVQVIGSESRRVVSPESSDAESPRLLARPGGGFWLAWLARRAEEAGYAVESPGEKRAFRWVEVVPLGASGEPIGMVRRVSSEKGRVLSFELARSGPDLVVIVQDEAARSEGAGARVVRYIVGEAIDSAEIIDGVGNAVAELVPMSSPGDVARWLAWSDMSERTHLTPLGGNFVAVGSPTPEPALDGARVLAAVSPNDLYVLGGTSPSDSTTPLRPELRRFICPFGPPERSAR